MSISRNKDEITSQLLQNCTLLILPGCQQPFEENELNCLKSFIRDGGRVLVLLSESNHDDTSNINILLEEFGIVPNMGQYSVCLLENKQNSATFENLFKLCNTSCIQMGIFHFSKSVNYTSFGGKFERASVVSSQ